MEEVGSVCYMEEDKGRDFLCRFSLTGETGILLLLLCPTLDNIKNIQKRWGMIVMKKATRTKATQGHSGYDRARRMAAFYRQ